MKQLNSDIIIRNIKLNILSGLPIDEIYQSIFEDLKSIFCDLERTKPYGKDKTLTFYIKKDTNDVYLFENGVGYLWVDLDNIWRVIVSKYTNLLNRDTTFSILSWYISEYLDISDGESHLENFADLKKHKEFVEDKETRI